MPWRNAATVVVDRDGRWVDADERALELLGVASIDELRRMSPDTFAAAPPDPGERAAWEKAYFASRAEGVFAESAFRRPDGELIRVRMAVLDTGDGTYRALFYPVERPTTNLTARIYRMADVLQEWRAAERQLVGLPPDSVEAREVLASIELLREQHDHLFERKR